MNRADLRANFDVTYLGEQKVADGVLTWHLRLVPKNKEIFKWVEAWVDIDGMPRQIQVADQNNDTTTVELSEIQKNIPVEAEAFVIKPAKGTKILQG
jgi:outer membrane lipoprotein-sorting protein